MKQYIPMVEAQMLIRRSVGAVFQAFIDPSVTINFWFTKSSGKLQSGKTINWTWEMYGVTTQVLVKEIIRNKSISIEWGNPATKVDFLFTSVTDSTTYVVIRNYGFKETGDELIRAINDNTGGFTTVLDGLKAYMEHGINLKLIGDKFPREAATHGE